MTEVVRIRSDARTPDLITEVKLSSSSLSAAFASHSIQQPTAFFKKKRAGRAVLAGN
jgi:hypothetical protein